MIRHLICLLCLSMLVAACTTSPTGRRQLMLVSPESAIVESKKAYLSTFAELDQQKKLITNPAVVKRVQTVTGRLVTEAVAMYPNSADCDWSLPIIDDPETINAWCMAGGRMAIYTGIIKKLDLTDDEMAQIMGHEISHALANHTAERMSRAMAINLGVVAAGVASDNSAAALTGAALAAKLALELPNSRTAESEADRIGTELASRAGYKPEAPASLWRKMAEQGGSGGPEFLSTHPAPGNREKNLTALVPEMKALNPTGKKSAVYPITIVK